MLNLYLAGLGFCVILQLMQLPYLQELYLCSLIMTSGIIIAVTQSIYLGLSLASELFLSFVLGRLVLLPNDWSRLATHCVVLHMLFSRDALGTVCN